MILSHKHKFIFFAIPKTATHTIRQALTPHMGPDDWEQQVLFGQKASPIPAIAAIRHGHISATQIRPRITEQQWHTYFKFGFVRNPYDRYVSTCFFLYRNIPNFESQAVPVMKQALRRPDFRRRILVSPQSNLLMGVDGKLAMDYVGRYETLQESFDEICQRIGIPGTDLGRKNASKHSRFTEYYDDDLTRIVSDFYSDDFENFDYPKNAS